MVYQGLNRWTEVAVVGSGVPNTALREALAQVGISYGQLARAVRIVAAEAGDSLATNKSAVAHWIVGGQPKPQTAMFVVEAVSRLAGRRVTRAELGLASPAYGAGLAPGLGLSFEDDPVAVLRELGEGDIQRRTFLTSAVYSVAAAALPLGPRQAADYQRRVAAVGRHAGGAEIEAVRDMTTMFTAIDERHGGQHGRAAVVQYLTSDVTRLCRASFAGQADKAAMLSAAAEVAYLCGWKANDAGEHGLAQRYYLQGFALTKEAGDDLHQAFILRIMAHNGMDLRRPEATLDLAETALRGVRGRVDPSAEAIFSVTLARALAHAGRPQDAVGQLRQAQDLVLRGDEQALPHWAGLWGSARACVNSHTAKTLNRIGDHAAAERYYGAAARARRNPDQHRITGLDLAGQGGEQAAQGHIEQACATWGRALTVLDGVRSARAAKAVQGMRRSVRPVMRRGARPAADLDERARCWLAST